MLASGPLTLVSVLSSARFPPGSKL